MRESYDSVTRKWMPCEEYYALKASRKASAARSEIAAPMLISDIGAYRSVVTGETIDGRRQHRDHLKRHDCVEVGNDYREPKRHELSRTERITDIKRSMGE